jgi:cytochrome c-550 PedF
MLTQRRCGTQWHRNCLDGRSSSIREETTMKTSSAILAFGSLLLSASIHAPAFAHGDVTPQAVDTRALPQLGSSWRDENPYRGNQDAIRIGTSAFNQNCARCHGIEAISGGIAPDLRMLDRDCMTMKNEARKQGCFKEIDKYFLTSVRSGKVRNGAVYMPPFEGVFSQEAMWAIKAYLETRRDSVSKAQASR